MTASSLYCKIYLAWERRKMNFPGTCTQGKCAVLQDLSCVGEGRKMNIA